MQEENKINPENLEESRQSRNNRPPILAFAVFPIVCCLLPILAGYAARSDNSIFMGFIKSEDAAQTAFIRFSSHGDFSSPFNLPGEDPQSWFSLFFSLLGLITRTGLPINYIFTAAIIVFALILVFASWKLVCYFTDDEPKRAFSFLLITCASGFGWLVAAPYFLLKKFLHFGGGEGIPSVTLIARHTPDLSFTQVSTLQVLHHPAHALENALFILFIISLARTLEEKKLSRVLGACAALPLIAFIHPYGLLVLVATCALLPVFAFFMDRKLLPQIIKAYLALAPFFALGAYQLFLHSVIIEKVVAKLSHPFIPPNKIFLAYGPVLILSLWGFKVLWNRRRAIDMITLSLISALFVLFHGPYRPHKFMGYMMLPLSLVAAEGITRFFLPRLKNLLKKIKRAPISSKALQSAALLVIFAFVAPTNLFHAGLFTYWTAVDGRYELCVSRDDYNAIQWLKNNALFRDVVLSSYLNWDRRDTINYPARYLPGEAGVTTVYTEKAELIVNDKEKARDITVFFNERTPDKLRREIIARRKINYIYYGPKEKMLGGWNPDKSPLVEKMFDSKTVDLFKARRMPAR